MRDNDNYTQEIDLSSLPAGTDLTDHIRMMEVLNRYGLPLDPFMELMAEYQSAAMQVEAKFRVLSTLLSAHAEDNPIETIKTRIKSPDSIVSKLIRQGDDISLASLEERIFDVAGVRVICSFIDDIYRLQDLFLRQDDITLVTRKDYIANPKKSGYRSLHLVVRTPIIAETWKKDVYVEVQMRTIAMDFWASLEHKLRYKKDIDPRALAHVNQELEASAAASARLDQRMQDIRDEIKRITGK